MTSSAELGINPRQRWCSHIWTSWKKAMSTFGADQGKYRTCTKCYKIEMKDT